MLETVDNLNGEIRQLYAKVQSLTQSKEEILFEIEKEEIPDDQEICGVTQIPQVTHENEHRGEDDPDLVADVEPDVDQAILEQDHNLTNKSGTSNESSLDRAADENVDEIEDPHMNSQADEDLRIYPECILESPTKYNLRIRLQNDYSELDRDDDPRVSDQEDHQKDISLTSKYVSKKSRHEKDVHKKMRNHVCDVCGYATKWKATLRNHMVSVHKIGEPKFKCKMCPYTSPQKGNFDYHMVSAHKIGEDKFKCQFCTFASPHKISFESHMVSVHKIGEGRFKCKMCPYSSFHKGNFRSHIKRIHGMHLVQLKKRFF